MPKVKTIPASKKPPELENCPNFHKTGSITGMKKLYYGKNALLVKCGSYIYNVSAYPHIYEQAQ